MSHSLTHYSHSLLADGIYLLGGEQASEGSEAAVACRTSGCSNERAKERMSESMRVDALAPPLSIVDARRVLRLFNANR